MAGVGATLARFRPRPEAPCALPGQRIGGGWLLSDLFSERTRAFTPCAGPPKHDRRGDKDRGIRSHHDAHDNRQREISQDGASKQEQTQNWNERDGASQNGAAQRLIDARIHDLFD